MIKVSFTKTIDNHGEPLFLELPMHRFLAATLLAAGLILSGINSSTAANAGDTPEESVIVTVDQAKVFRISRPAATVIIGNPAIVDGTIEDAQTLVLTGRSFGVTNLIILDEAGDAIVDRTVVVRGHEANTVRVYRRSSRETLACAPVCEPTLTIGDDNESFTYASEQIQARNSLSEASAN